MKELKEKISLIAQEASEKSGYLFIDCDLKSKSTQLLIEIFIDSKEGVTAKDCANVSRIIADEIDSQSLIESKYILDVSSPGSEKPLKYMEQYYKLINRKLEITYSLNNNENTVEAKLQEIKDDVLILNVNKEIIEIKFSDIKTAKVIFSF